MRELAERTRATFSQRLQSIETAELALLERCNQLSAERPNVRVAERLRTITLASVDKPGQNIRSESLLRAGLVTLLDAQKYFNVLEQLPDIGGVTAERIRRIVARAAQPLP